VEVESIHAVDLTLAPFDAHSALISSKTTYADSQRLGRDMREGGIESFRYPSARDTMAGINVGLFSPAAFAAKKPKRRQSWFAVADLAMVEFRRKDHKTETYRARREDYEVDGRLPAPAL
jgi:hypothetical protein